MADTSNDIDPKELRNALGAFATGITIVTARDGNGQPVGLTVNSFNSVSLDPPLVLWSIDRSASLFDAFEQAEWYAVHVLTAEQQHLSDTFYQKPWNERFDGLELEAGLGDLPLLTNCSARFECSVNARYPGGDHIILMGKIERYTTDPQEPLLFYSGGYRQLAE